MRRPSRDQLGGEGKELSKMHGSAFANVVRAWPSGRTIERVLLILGG